MRSLPSGRMQRADVAGDRLAQFGQAEVVRVEGLAVGDRSRAASRMNAASARRSRRTRRRARRRGRIAGVRRPRGSSNRAVRRSGSHGRVERCRLAARGARMVGDAIRRRAKRPARPHVEGVVRRDARRCRAAVASPRRARSSRRCRCRAPAPGKCTRRLALLAFARQSRAQRGVRADAAGDDEPVAGRSARARPSTCAPARRRSPPASTPRGRRAPARRSSRAARACVRTAVFRPANEKSSESRLQQRPRQRVGVGIAELGQPRQRRAAGIAEAEQLRRLVERLAGGVVDGVAEQRVAADVGRRCSSCVWPPETSSATKGNVGGSAERNGDSRCPSR